MLSNSNISNIKVGISACILKASSERIKVFNGRPLSYVEYSMPHWVASGGGIPLMLPPPAVFFTLETGQKLSDLDKQTREATLAILRASVQSIDCLLLHGGVDIAPENYGQTALDPDWQGDWQRDQFEIALFRLAVEMNKPVLGICRGHQLINVALGGTLYQDTFTQRSGALEHRSQELYETLYHDLILVEGSSLHRLYHLVETRTNSVHHQAIDQLAPGLIIDAFCPDDQVIEAVSQCPDHFPNHYIRGIQWHPEFQKPELNEDEASLLPPHLLLKDLLDAVKARAQNDY